MRLPFHQLPVQLIGVCLVVLYITAQLGIVQYTNITACDAARSRFSDVIVLVLFYEVTMFLRSYSIDRMIFPHDAASNEPISAVVLTATIISSFLACRMIGAYHLFPDMTPPDADRIVTTRERNIQMAGGLISIVLLLLDVLGHIRSPPIKGISVYLPWFLLPRILLLVLWFIFFAFLPALHGEHRFVFRSYFWAFILGLFFIRPAVYSVLGLGVLLGVLTYSIATFGAQPLFGSFVTSSDGKHVYQCPYDIKQPLVPAKSEGFTHEATIIQ